MREINVANPGDKNWAKGCFVFWFGAHCPTYVLAYGSGIEDALEEAAGWLADSDPVHLIEYGGDEHTELVKEACEDAGVEFDPAKLCGSIEEPYDRILEDAEADLTYTESGFLTSYEWGIALDNPSPKEIADFAHERT